MRFKVFMINNDGNRFEETIIANNDMEAKRDAQSFNLDSTVLKAEWVYK